MELFYELVQVALGNRNLLIRVPCPDEWEQVFQLAQKQCITGIIFNALDGLGVQGQKLPREILYKWINYAEQIKWRNLIVNKRCVEITQMFASEGLRTCILKGQSNAMLYPDSLTRVPGDIDIWVDANRSEIDAFVHCKFPSEKGGRQHIKFPVFEDVPVEVHYIPTYMRTPWYDKQLQSFFREYADEQFCHFVTLEGSGGMCAVPTAWFSMVQQMAHLMSHFMGEGIGLRQFIDYYYVLKACIDETDSRHLTEIIGIFRCCGLLKFASGVMWIEKELLGLEDKYIIVEPSERMGQAIQRIIEEGGNFGHHNRLNVYRHKNLAYRAIGGTYQSFRALNYLPSETIWKIIRKVI